MISKLFSKFKRNIIFRTRFSLRYTCKNKRKKLRLLFDNEKCIQYF